MQVPSPASRLNTPEVAERCAGEPAGDTTKITSTPNGPNMVETDEELTATVAGMEKKVRSPCFLCHCGQSKNKPFCDGSHLAAKFEAPAAEIRGKKA